MLALGIILFIIGGLAMIAGILLAVRNMSGILTDPDSDLHFGRFIRKHLVATALFGIGFIVFCAGIVLMATA